MNFESEKHEKDYLSAKDPALGAYIRQTGDLAWPIHGDLFGALVYEILGQQISLKAALAIRERVKEGIVPFTPEHVAKYSVNELKSFGMTARKAEYILNIARQINNGSLNLNALKDMNDEEALKTLLKLKGVGVWTAEMVLMFGLGRRNIFSWLDIAVRRGVMRIHRLDSIDRDTFEKYRQLYSPYGSTASLYFWAASHDKELQKQLEEEKILQANADDSLMDADTIKQAGEQNENDPHTQQENRQPEN